MIKQLLILENARSLFVLLFMLLLFSGSVFGQVTIVSDGLNSSTSLFTLSGGAYYTGNSASGDRPATSAFAAEGTYSRGVSNNTATLTSLDVNTAGHTSVSLAFRLAAFSIGSTTNGLDTNDLVTVEVSPNGGTNYYSTIRVSGNTNAYWSYGGGTANASTAYDGNTTPVDFQPAGTGNRTTDGYSTVTVTGLPATSNLRVRITLVNNDSAERWVVDDFKVTGTAAAPCSGPPTAGTANAAPISVVSGGTINLSLTGTTVASGLTYQWQQSANGTTGWANVSGTGTNSTYTTTLTAKTFYSCVVTCSGNSANSSVVEVNLAYCTSTYTIGPGTTDQIINVTLASLNNPSGGSSPPYYTFYDTLTIPNITTSTTASVQVSVGTDSKQFVAAWIDFNQNGVFEASEGLISGNAGASGTATLNFSVPSGATLGNTRMRIRGGNDSALTTDQACGASSSGFGETEDYIVNIVAPSVTPVLAIAGATNNGSSCPTVAAIPQTYTITNTGSSAATGVTVVSNNAQFVVSGLSSTTIAGSGGTATYTVTFTPTTAGAKTATITVASTTSGSNSPTSSLTGTGTTAVTAVAVTGSATGIITVGATLAATNATTFGICPATTAKGFVYAVTATNATPTVGGTGVTNQAVTLGTSGAYSQAVTGLASGTNYSYRTYLYDGSTYTYGSVVTFNTVAPLANDEICNAINLSVSTTCNSISGTNVSATASVGIPAPGCASYSGGDVWYKATVPSNGSLTVDTTAGGITDGGLAFYSSSDNTCSGTLTLLECDDDDGIGSMGMIAQTGLTPGNIIFIRVWEYGNNAFGTFNICASTLPAPVITSLSASSGCVGESLIITGTNLAAATVTIGGSATVKTANTATSITVTIGSGTTGFVNVLTSGGTVSSVASFTVNPLPATPGVPTSNSPQCTPTGVTLTRTGSVPVGETWFWQTTASGTSEVNSGATFNAATSGTYYIRSKNTTTGCWSASASLAVEVSSTISTLATVLSPTNNNTTVCYSGTGATSSLSWTAAAGATSYDVYFGSGSMPGTVTANVATASYTVGTLLPSTTYYWKVVPRNGCGVSTGTVVNWSFTTQAGICYCPSNPSSNHNSGISNVVMGSANFAVSDVTYYNYTGSVPNLTQGASIASSITFVTGFSYHNHIWIDFNDDGVFNNTNEKVFSGESLAANPTTYSTTFTLGGTSAVGLHKMRIGTADSGQSTPNPCYSGSFGVTIDLMVNIIPSCTPTHTITSFSPTSGPVGTVVTVIGTGFAGTTAVLGAVTATVSDLSSTQFKVTIPSGAITSDLVLTDNASCPSIAGTFTVINSDINSCQTADGGGGTLSSDLIIYEVYDEKTGSGGVVTIYNGTGATVDLSTYTIDRAGVYGGAITNVFPLSGTIPAGAVAVIGVTTSTCGYTPTNNGSFGTTGFNEDDGFRLMNGATLIDDFHAPNTAGYYVKRKNTNLIPNTTYTDSEWTTQILGVVDCLTDVTTVPVRVLPVITTQPISTTYSCEPNSVTFTVTATEGVAAGLALAYQWYFNVPGNGGWSAVSGSNFSGETTATLTVSNAALYEDYQFYAQVRENTATCYNASEAVSIKGGDSGTITYAAGAWVGGLPTDITKIVVIDSGQTYNTIAGAITARRLINNGTIIVNKAHPVIVDLNLENNGTFEILDDASFVQNCNVENEFGNNNVGQIKMLRETPDMFRYDFTYWSSPVKDFVLKQVSPFTLFDKFFSWNALTQAWQVHKSNLAPLDLEVMKPGRGYTVRAPQSYNVQGGGPAASHTANFIGIPNNGTVTQAIAISNDINVAKWNLIGNPYPSALDANKFLSANSNLGGTLYFWTHKSSPTNGGSGSYYTYNSADYVSWNGSGSTTGCAGCVAPLGQIGAGQSFFVKGIGQGTGLATFNNTMRLAENNDQFYKPSPTEVAAVEERHRVWLNLTGATKGFNQTLIGYVYDATNGLDNRFDGESFGGNEVTLYSVLDTKRLVIQGRALPFLVQDVVPLGYKTTLTGNLTISIDHADGLLLNQAIYLEDTVLNVTHNLTTSNYVFASVPGTFNSRFVLRYLPQQDLENPTFEDKIQGVTIRKNNADLHVNSPYELIDIVRVYDITGRLVFERKQCNSNRFDTSHIVGNDQTLIVKVQLVNGGIVTQKVY